MLQADFQVSDHGKVKLADNPLKFRLRPYTAPSGHKAFKLCGRAYYVAELVANVHRPDLAGFLVLDYADGDPNNCRADNLVGADRETPTSLLRRCGPII